MRIFRDISAAASLKRAIVDRGLGRIAIFRGISAAASLKLARGAIVRGGRRFGGRGQTASRIRRLHANNPANGNRRSARIIER
jgi:hypothetical protein